MLFFLAFGASFLQLQCIPVPINQMQFLISLADDIYGGDNDFSFLNKYGGTPIINHTQDGEIPKFSLWRKNEDLYLIIRGSANAADWISNFEIEDYYDANIGAHFHDGFYQTGVEVWNIIAREVENQNATGTVYFTGHSRGASVAEVVHVYGRRQLLNSGFRNGGENFQTVAFAPAPAMSEDGDVRAVVSHFTMFVHNRDIVPILCIGDFGAAAVACTADGAKDTDFCKALTNVKVEDRLRDIEHVHSIVGDNLYWLKYDCDFLGFNCKLRPILSQSKSSSDEILAFDINRLSIINGTAISDHYSSHYLDYLNAIVSETSTHK